MIIETKSGDLKLLCENAVLILNDIDSIGNDHSVHVYQNSTGYRIIVTRWRGDRMGRFSEPMRTFILTEAGTRRLMEMTSIGIRVRSKDIWMITYNMSQYNRIPQVLIDKLKEINMLEIGTVTYDENNRIRTKRVEFNPNL